MICCVQTSSVNSCQICNRPVLNSTSVLLHKRADLRWLKKAAFLQSRLGEQIVHHLLQIMSKPVIPNGAILIADGHVATARGIND